MHQITAYGGNKGPVPFQQAIPQSPAFQPIPDNYIPEQTTQQFLQALNVSTIQQARGLPSMVLRNVNYLLVGMGSYGTFAFGMSCLTIVESRLLLTFAGPVVDGDFVPALPGKLLLQGSYDKDLTLMIGHNSDEVRRISAMLHAHLLTATGFDLYQSLYHKRHCLDGLSPARLPSRHALGPFIHYQRTISAHRQRNFTSWLYKRGRTCCVPHIRGPLYLQYQLPRAGL